MLLENENNRADRELKAVLYDYISSKIKELASVSDVSFYEQYVQLLADITDSADSLAVKIERLESLQIPSVKEDSVINKTDYDTSIDKDETEIKQDTTDIVNESDLVKESESVPTSSDIKEESSASDEVQEVVSNDSNEEVEKTDSTVVSNDSTPNTFADIFANADSGVVTNTPDVRESVNDVNNVLVNEPVQNSVSVTTQIRKLSDTKPKAILVNRRQLSKLGASKDTQAALLDFGLQSGVQSTNNSQKNLEEMMARASLLYKEGKVQEAQALYNEISQLNKSNGNVLVKTA